MVRMRNIVSVLLLTLFVVSFAPSAHAEWKLFSDDSEDEHTHTEAPNKKQSETHKKNPTSAEHEKKQHTGIENKQHITENKHPTETNPRQPATTENKQPTKTKNKKPREKTVPYCWHYSYLYNKNITIPNELKNPSPKKEAPAGVQPPKPANTQEKNRFSLMVAVAMGYMSAVQDITRSRMDVKIMLKDLNGFCTQYPKAPYEDAVRAVTQVKKSVQELIINEKKIWKKQQGQIGAVPSVY